MRLQQQVDDWNRELRFAFNCHTVSIGALLGMNKDEWIEGSASSFTASRNPAQMLLDAYFHERREATSLDTVCEHARHNDIVVLRDHQTGDLVHTGRILVDTGHKYFISKLGEYPVVITSLDSTAEQYRGQYDRVQLYRLGCPQRAGGVGLSVTDQETTVSVVPAVI